MSKCTAILLLVHLFIYLFQLIHITEKRKLDYYLALLFNIRIPTHIQAIFVKPLHSESINPDF